MGKKSFDEDMSIYDTKEENQGQPQVDRLRHITDLIVQEQ